MSFRVASGHEPQAARRSPAPEAPALSIQRTHAVVAFYCACSAGMLLINKLAVHHIASPAFVTLTQFLATVVGVLAGYYAGWIELDRLEWAKLRAFVLYVLAFSGGTWANMHVLQSSNVETVIVFRSCAPLAVAVLEYLFYDRALPSARSTGAMLLLVVGAACYVSVDRQFQASGWSAYSWVLVWFVLLVFQLTYSKHLVTGLGLTSIWSPVLYTNALSLLPTAVIGQLSGDFAALSTREWTSAGLSWLLLSCVAGMGISWAGFKCQALITATAYTVVGVMNKLLTVTANVLIWDKHASLGGIASLGLCLIGGSLYQQAPLRSDRADERNGTSGEKAPCIERGTARS